MSNTNKNTAIIKSLSSNLGFLDCKIAKAEFLDEEVPKLETWLKKNAHGKMQYMENHFDLRLDPTKLVPNSKSVVCLTYNYFTDESQEDPTAPKISKYAYGKDYHKVVKKKLKLLIQQIREQIGEVEGRAFVDSAPILEKAWAQKSGIGWIGKHSNILTKETGSFYFLCELVLDLELEYDTPVADHCGTCTKCIDACPTDAIESPYYVNGSKCISYLTIELKDTIIPTEFEGKMDNWAFGCDICQDVCPWNRFSKPNKEAKFAPQPGLLSMKSKDWEELTEDVFDKIFEGSAVKRTKFEGLKRNLNFIRKNKS
ncbi:MAG: epoxyqueuosine reductase [Sphingobacteriales bacterium]